jgi:hypothetical protein
MEFLLVRLNKFGGPKLEHVGDFLISPFFSHLAPARFLLKRKNWLKKFSFWAQAEKPQHALAFQPKRRNRRVLLKK